MNTDVVNVALESGDKAKLAAVARDLGRQLAARTGASWLKKFRQLAARASRTRAADYERGFIEALELVATGFERQERDEAADADELSQLQARPSWIDMLRLLARGVVLPTELAEKMDVSPARITRLVDELEDAELVVQTSDGRQRPCRLTPRARVLLERLPPAPESADQVQPAIADVIEGVVPAVVRCMSALVRNRRMGRSRLFEALMGSSAVDPIFVQRVLDKALLASRWATLDQDDAWVATDAELQTRLQQHLALACRGHRLALVERIAEMSRRRAVILRVSRGLLEWDVAMRELERVCVVRAADLEGAEVRAPVGDYQVVYESPSLLESDLYNQRMQKTIAQAKGRYCLAAMTSEIPNFVSIPVGIPEYAV